MVCNGVLSGVVSGGEGCAVPGYPGVYSDVYFFRDWILQNAKIEDDEMTEGSDAEGPTVQGSTAEGSSAEKVLATVFLPLCLLIHLPNTI